MGFFVYKIIDGSKLYLQYLEIYKDIGYVENYDRDYNNKFGFSQDDAIKFEAEGQAEAIAIFIGGNYERV